MASSALEFFSFSMDANKSMLYLVQALFFGISFFSEILLHSVLAYYAIQCSLNYLLRLIMDNLGEMKHWRAAYP
jgi:hypothetical protein